MSSEQASWTDLHRAAALGDVTGLAEAIGKIANFKTSDINVRTKEMETPLFLAVSCGVFVISLLDIRIQNLCVHTDHTTATRVYFGNTCV